MEQNELIALVSERPQSYAWFLGAGASCSAGLPGATDVIWYLKRRHYCAEENQDIDLQDMQNDAVRAKVQAYFDSKGYPGLWAPEEYTSYFERIFGEDRERQRAFLKAYLSEDKVTLTIGSRVLAALMMSGRARMVFTTNFDTVVEKAVADVSGKSLAAYHIEGARSANSALNNEEFPIYCKLHGDFRYDSIKNLSDDLVVQNEELGRCLVNAGNRFGFVVTGYSGRDKSVMDLFHAVLDAPNPFPAGFFWTGLSAAPIMAVVDLIEKAKKKGITAEYVKIETFDALMNRLWRQIPDKPLNMDKKVRREELASVNIPISDKGTGKPLVRFNGLPIVSMPGECFTVSLTSELEWKDLGAARWETEGRLILTKSDYVFGWGQRSEFNVAFGKKLQGLEQVDISSRLSSINEHRYLIGFIEQAIAAGLARDLPLLTRLRAGSRKPYLIADGHSDDQSALASVAEAVGKLHGEIAGLFAPVTEEFPAPDRVYWAEALKVLVDTRNGRPWLLVEPDIWIWPQRAREVATDFMRDRRSRRYNKKHNEIIDAWLTMLFGKERNQIVEVSPFSSGDVTENPVFQISTRTAFSRRLAS